MSWFSRKIRKLGRAIDLSNPAVLKKAPGALLTTLNPYYQGYRLVVRGAASIIPAKTIVGSALRKTGAGMDLVQRSAERHPLQVGMVAAGGVLMATGVGTTAGTKLVLAGTTTAIADELRREAAAKAGQRAAAEAAIQPAATDPHLQGPAAAAIDAAGAAQLPVVPLSFGAWLRTLVHVRPRATSTTLKPTTPTLEVTAAKPAAPLFPMGGIVAPLVRPAPLEPAGGLRPGTTTTQPWRPPYGQGYK